MLRRFLRGRSAAACARLCATPPMHARLHHMQVIGRSGGGAPIGDALLRNTAWQEQAAWLGPRTHGSRVQRL